MADAADISQLAGTWKLVSFVMVDEETKKQEPLYGAHPNGYLILLPEGRMMTVITGENRKSKPETDEDRVAAFKSMLAYSGTYKVDGDRFVTKVDTAWNQSWVGSDQKRTYRVEGDQLTIISMAQPAVNFENRMMHGELVWQRVK
ncbi:MAG: lipocalin-like domain-containing protein [Pseudomonadota bacterium]